MIASAPASNTATEELPLLDRAVLATRQTERPYAEELLRTFTEQATVGTCTWDRCVSKTLTDAINKIDAAISKQLAAIQHAPALQKLEGSWRGLHYLVMNTETSSMLKLKVLGVTEN